MSNDKAPFAWDDPFQLQDQFTEEERMIQSSARDYAQDKLFFFTTCGWMMWNWMTDITDFEKAEGYLAHKWNLAGNLPSDHTYKSSAP